MKARLAAAAALAVAASTAGLMVLMAPAGATTTATTATTAISNRPDSGIQGNNWAYDAFKRTATISRQGVASPSNCGNTSPCYAWAGEITDSNGTFTTIAGQASPGAGGYNGGTDPVMGESITGTMSGTYHYSFFSDQAATSATPPPSEDDGDALPTGEQTTCLWLEQFFSAGNFWDSSGNAAPGCIGTTGSWKYQTKFGADTACPNVSSRWIDASFSNWGADPADGNILAPDATHC